MRDTTHAALLLVRVVPLWILEWMLLKVLRATAGVGVCQYREDKNNTEGEHSFNTKAFKRWPETNAASMTCIFYI